MHHVRTEILRGLIIVVASAIPFLELISDALLHYIGRPYFIFSIPDKCLFTVTNFLHTLFYRFRFILDNSGIIIFGERILSVTQDL